jgi:hypothetical protein
MKILITRVDSVEAKCQVLFECECGQGCGLWVGAPPIPGEYRHIELEIESPAVLGQDFVETNEPIGLRATPDGSIIVGELLIADSIGFARLDLGCGGLDVEVTAAPKLIVGGRYRLAAPGLKVFDCNL